MITQAFQAIQGQTQAPLGAPAKLPAIQTGYPGAQTQATINHWMIQLVDTKQPDAVNSQNLSGNIITGAAAWSATELSSAPSNALSTLETYNGLWQPSAVVNTNTPRQATQVGTAQYGHSAVLYPVTGNAWTNTKLVWTEGEWTIEVVGSNAKSEEMAAYSIANNLHFQALPPYPGLMMVYMVAPASSQTMDINALTTLDWIQGSTVYSVSVSQASTNNPEQAINMANSWAAWRG